MTTWRSRIPEILRNFDGAQSRGLEDGAELLADAIRDRLREGYTSGQFTTGEVAESVGHDVRQAGGDISAKVFSPSEVALAWEIGHHNLFTRQFERVEIWGPLLFEHRREIAQVFARRFKRELRI